VRSCAVVRSAFSETLNERQPYTSVDSTWRRPAPTTDRRLSLVYHTRDGGHGVANFSNYTVWGKVPEGSMAILEVSFNFLKMQRTISRGSP